MKSFIYSGVDPGKNGAIASIDEDGIVLKISRFIHADTEGRIALVIADHFAELDQTANHSAIIERVSAMPRQGVSSMFTFGRVYGEAWSGLLLANPSNPVRVSSVTPSMWQRDLLLPKRDCVTNHKRTLKEEAEKRFGRKFLLAEADAAWLAEWGRKKGPWSRGMRSDA